MRHTFKNINETKTLEETVTPVIHKNMIITHTHKYKYKFTLFILISSMNKVIREIKI